MSAFPTSHSLMMSCISTLSSFELVLEFFLCVCVSSVEFLIWHSNRISFVFTLNVVSSFLLPHIKARLRVESRFNCAARSSDCLNCEYTSAFQSVASFNKYSLVIFGSRVSQSESSSARSGSVTRACSYSQLPALPEVLSRSVQAPRTPGQNLKVRRTLVSHSATCLLLRIVDESSHLPLLLCHFLSTIQILILCSVASDAHVRFPLRMLFILHWSRRLFCKFSFRWRLRTSCVSATSFNVSAARCCCAAPGS